MKTIIKTENKDRSKYEIIAFINKMNGSIKKVYVKDTANSWVQMGQNDEQTKELKINYNVNYIVHIIKLYERQDWASYVWWRMNICDSFHWEPMFYLVNAQQTIWHFSNRNLSTEYSESNAFSINPNHSLLRTNYIGKSRCPLLSTKKYKEERMVTTAVFLTLVYTSSY